MKIHVPDIVHRHKHVKIKNVHVFHPKVVHTEPHHSIQFLHSRHDPNVGLINGGYPQPLLNLSPSTNEYRISEDDFFKWRREQQRRAQEKRKKLQQQQRHQQNDDDDEYEDNGAEEEEEQPNYDEELYKKHKANKANTSSQQKKESKHKNHNYTPDYDSSNSNKVYSNYAQRSKLSSKKQQKRPSFRPSPPVEDETIKKYRVYGVSNVDAESTNLNTQYLTLDPTATDPGYYSTLPKNIQNVPPAQQDDIYSGLLAKKYNREIADKSKLLADINYSRKQQTKNLIQRRRSQQEEEEEEEKKK